MSTSIGTRHGQMRNPDLSGEGGICRVYIGRLHQIAEEITLIRCDFLKREIKIRWYYEL